jgi:hypothetical protein
MYRRARNASEGVASILDAVAILLFWRGLFSELKMEKSYISEYYRISYVTKITMKTIALALLGALALSSVSCMTTYDAYGNPRQTVDPGVAVAGVAAAGILGYALANDNDHGHHRHNGPPRRPSGHYDRRRY